MLGERVGLSCSSGWDQTHPEDAPPFLHLKQGACSQLWKGLWSRGSEAFYSRGRATPTKQHSFAFWRLFQMQRVGLGGNQG